MPDEQQSPTMDREQLERAFQEAAAHAAAQTVHMANPGIPGEDAGVDPCEDEPTAKHGSITKITQLMPS